MQQRYLTMLALSALQAASSAQAAPPSGAADAAAGAAARAPVYRITREVALGAPDHWDYVVHDASADRAYVAHGDRVDVIDARDGRVLGHIRGIAGGAHGVAIVPAAGNSRAKGFIADGESAAAVVFDPQSLAAGQRIRGGADADAMAYDPASRHVFLMNGDTGTITVIDPAAERAIATIQGGGKLEAAVADGKGTLYVNGAGQREILAIDTRTNAIARRHAVPTCESPHGLALDAERGNLFVTCKNRLMLVVDAASGSVRASLPIGRGTDGAGFDPRRRRAFSSNGQDGNLTVVGERDGTWSVLGSIPTAVSGRTMDVDPASGRLFIVAGTPAPGSDRGVAPGSLKLLLVDPAD